MPRGYPDDNIQSYPLGQTIVDNSELAVRLGAFTTLQRSGQMIYGTKFTNGMSEWITSITGNGYAKVKATLGAYDNTSLELFCGTVAATKAAVAKYMPMIDATRIGLEFIVNFQFNVPVAGPIILIDVLVNSHGFSYIFQFTINANTNQILVDYLDTFGVPQTYTITIPYALRDDSVIVRWHYFKLTADVQGGKYLRLLVDDLAFDLSSLIALNGVATAYGFIQAYYSYTYLLNGGVTHLGSTIITINEP